MARYLVERGIHAALVLILISFGVFLMINLAPGGPSVLMSQDLTAEDAARIRRNLGLDQPAHLRYFTWASGLVKGDLGLSFEDRRPVGRVILDRLPATLLLGGAALLLSILVAVPTGVTSAVRPGSAFDVLASVLSFFGVAMPVFWFGLMLILLFAVYLRWLPSAGMYEIGAPFSLQNRLQHLLMPSLVLALPTIAELTRYTRSSMLDVLSLDFVRTAHAKGLSPARVLYRHALKNALIPVVSLLGVSLPRLVGGAAITETIFAWPGIGRLAVTSALSRDYPVVMGITMLVALMVLLSSLMVDLSYGWLDPRIRHTEGQR